jgi:hypothetical protein
MWKTGYDDLALSAAQISRNALTRIIHQPKGASPRFASAWCKPDASAFRLISAALWAKWPQLVCRIHLREKAG